MNHLKVGFYLQDLYYRKTVNFYFELGLKESIGLILNFQMFRWFFILVAVKALFWSGCLLLRNMIQLINEKTDHFKNSILESIESTNDLILKNLMW